MRLVLSISLVNQLLLHDLLQRFTFADFADPYEIFHIVDGYLQPIRVEEVDEAAESGVRKLLFGEPDFSPVFPFVLELLLEERRPSA